MTDASYVRTAMLPPQKPPASETGIVHWVRTNLLSSWGNIVLTVLSLYVIYMIVAAIGPWLYRSVWNAGSLEECRAIVTASYGEGKRGACFAVINERWQQIVFGFYPKELYWRPTLTLVLMLVALGPILFSWVPRQVLWFSLTFPAVAFWLLWGGTVWLPVMILVGFALGYAAFRGVSGVNGLAGVLACRSCGGCSCAIRRRRWRNPCCRSGWWPLGRISSAGSCCPR